MKSAWLLGIIALVQLVFATLLVALLFFNRSRQRQVSARNVNYAQRVSRPLHEWVIGVADIGGLKRVLAELPPEQALEQLLVVATLSVTEERMAELAEALHGEPWVTRLARRAHSRLWWRRLQAARLLSMVGTPADRALVRALLDDPHPAVQTAATTCLARCADEPLVDEVLRALHRRTTVVRNYQFDALRRAWRLTVPALLRRVAEPGITTRELEVALNLVEAIGTPDVIRAALPHATHPEANVRLAVARTLKKYFHADAVRVSVDFLADPDWRVRGQAARALGTLGNEGAVPHLLSAMSDRSWWVRFRAGLALAQLGERGRAELRGAREMEDRFGRDMARMISGLSDGGLVELSEA